MSRFSTLGCLALVPAALVCVVALPGCGSKVTADNYAAIKPEMSDADVVKILGNPTSSVEEPGVMGPMTTKVWQDGSKSITITFVQGRILDMKKIGI